MYYFYVVLTGMVAGLGFLWLVPKGRPQKLKVDEDSELKGSKESKKTLPPQGATSESDERKSTDPSEIGKHFEKMNDEVRKRQKELSRERKEKLLKNLSPQDRALVEDYFSKKAQTLLTGVTNEDDRKFEFTVKLLKVGFFIFMAILLYLGLTIALKTNKPSEIFASLKFMAIQFIKQIIRQ